MSSPPARVVSHSRRGWREIVTAAVLVTIAVIPFLFLRFPPGSKDRYCGSLIEVRGPIRIFLNCDSDEFLRTAKEPALLMAEKSVRQNRPLYSIAGWLLASPLRALGVAGRSGRLSGEYLPEYLGLIALNWSLLVASVVLFARLLAATSLGETRLLIPLAILLVNEISKAFFWTPHVQMFNIFIPVASLALYRWMQPRLPTLTMGQVAAIGTAIGLGNLAYGAFAVTAAGAVVGVVFGEGTAALRARPSPKLRRAALLVVCFLAPLLAWMALVTWRTGGFYSHEIAYYRQFVWMADSASRGGAVLAADLARNLVDYAKTLVAVAALPAILIAIAAALAGRRDRKMNGAVAWYVVANIPFFALMGFYATRLTWTIVPALLVLLAEEIEFLDRVAPVKRRRALRAGAAGLVLGYALYWFVKVGPYS